MGYVEQTPNAETKVELIKTLQSVTEGKVRLVVYIQACLQSCCLASTLMQAHWQVCMHACRLTGRHVCDVHKLITCSCILGSDVQMSR